MGLVPEQPDTPTGAEHRAAFDRARRRVDPVPGLAGGQEIEAAVARVPLLDRARLDPHAAAAGHCRHPRVGLEPEHVAAPGHEQAGHDPGAAPHVEHGPRLLGHEHVDQRGWVGRPDPVVALGDRRRTSWPGGGR